MVEGPEKPCHSNQSQLTVQMQSAAKPAGLIIMEQPSDDEDSIRCWQLSPFPHTLLASSSWKAASAAAH